MEGGFLDPKKSKGPDWTRLGGLQKIQTKVEAGNIHVGMVGGYVT